MTIPQSVLDRAVILLVSGMSEEAAGVALVSSRVCSESMATKAIDQARNKITLTASFDRNEKLGTAIRRLESLYTQAFATKDVRTALQAQRELNKLLDLYGPSAPEDPTESPSEDSDVYRRQLDIIAGYLLPIGLATEEYPLEEHARLAAELIRTHALCPNKAQ